MGGGGDPYFRNIFSLENNLAMCFEIVPREAVINGRNCTLRRLIETAGGIVLEPGETDPFAVKILDLHWYFNNNLGPPLKFSDDVFSPAFVEDSYLKNERQDLNKYRLGKVTNVDANLVALRKSGLMRTTPVERNRDLLSAIGVPLNSRSCTQSADVEEVVLSMEGEPVASSTAKECPQRSSDRNDVTTTSLASPGRTVTAGTGFSRGRKSSCPQKVQPNSCLFTSSDDDSLDSTYAEKEVTRRKFFKSRRRSPTAQNDVVNVPDVKKRRQIADSTTTHKYSAARLYSNAGSPEKLSVHAKVNSSSRAVAACRGAVLNGSQENVPQSHSANILFRDIPKSSAPKGENIPHDNHPKNIALPVGSSSGNKVTHILNKPFPQPRNDYRDTRENSSTKGMSRFVVHEPRARNPVLYNFSSDEDISMPSSPDRMSSAPTSSNLGPYTIEDGKTLLRFICDHNLHYFYSGMKPWKKAQEEQLIRGRSASSMWEHFRKKVYPNRQKIYGCTDLDMKKFAVGKKVKNENRKLPAPENLLYKKRS
ncbi:unnamed protein product [Allacma fusca]|uniref:Repressor/activator protein 1 homolog n=1 Tax=Allacma fusca TaxID=39272 RepID=A0A8J2JA23_9HEXA|nr:unnamed protein product [Allacma fusca]